VTEDIVIRGVGGEWSAQGEDDDNFTVDFTVTTESLLQLTGLVTGTTQTVELKDSAGDIIFNSPNEPFGSFDSLLTLAPGTYELLGSASFQVGGGPSGFTTDLPFSSGFDLSADFTAVPEPTGIPIILLGLFAAAGIVAERRRRRTASRF
jgi:hypothetical protein